MKILLAEDDYSLARGVTALLQHSGFTVDAVHDGISALDYALLDNYDCMIFDIMMPGLDGLQLVRQLRSRGNQAPILLLTAKGEVGDRIAGLDAGADDYLPKPFVSGELVARIRALTRRSAAYIPAILRYADIELDPASFHLICGKQHVPLGNKAFQVMELLMRNPSVVLSTDTFMDKVWGWESEAEMHVVWVNISFLRKQLAQLSSRVCIKTHRGIGYSLEEMT